MLGLKLYLLALVLCFLFLGCFFAFSLTRMFIDKDKSLMVAQKKTRFVLILFLIIYIIPIIAMIVSIFLDAIYIFVIGCLMVISAIPITYLIIIPILDKREIKFIEQVYGKDSEEANNARKRYNKK